MEIKLYNSLSNKIEVFHPLHEGEVTCYVCGPTVYNYVHVGNMRPVVVFDVLRRLFLYLGYKVTFISNFTDIDDKIIKQAQKENLTEAEIAEKYIKAFEEAREGVHALKPTYQPRVSKIKDYGCLSNMKVEDLLVGARIEENSKKESPLDFALWKKTNEGIQFDSPWSKGRPGWHSECVVMINSLVPGGKIDIHGGGFDLKFPHHENEIAQEEAVKGHKIANYWMHNGFINVDNVKMSKSLGNVILANDYINLYGGNVVRFMLVNTHYRVPVNFSNDLVESAKKELDKISSTYIKLAVNLQLNNISLDDYSKEDVDMQLFLEAMCDDLNTANAMSELYRIVKEGNIALRNKPLDLQKIRKAFFTIKDMLSILGFEFDIPHLTNEDIDLYKQYLKAKEEKNFTESDKIRPLLIERKIL